MESDDEKYATGLLGMCPLCTGLDIRTQEEP